MRESIMKQQAKLKDLKKYKESHKTTDDALKYLQLHKDCPFGRLEYGLTLMYNKELEEAEQVFKSLLEEKSVQNRALHNLIRVLFFQYKYQECYDYCLLLEYLDKKLYDEKSFKYYKYFCANELNIPAEYDELDYMTHCLLNYNSRFVVNHIKYHTKEFIDSNPDEIDYSRAPGSVFKNDVDIEQLYEEVSKILKLDDVKQMNWYAITSYIYFKYDNIGINTNGKQNYLVAMKISNTDKLISLYPAMGVERTYLANGFPVFDYFEKLEEANSIKQKAL